MNAPLTSSRGHCLVAQPRPWCRWNMLPRPWPPLRLSGHVRVRLRLADLPEGPVNSADKPPERGDRGPTTLRLRQGQSQQVAPVRKGDHTIRLAGVIRCSGHQLTTEKGGANQDVDRGRDEWRVHRSLGGDLHRSDGDPRHHVDQEGSLGDVHNRDLLATLLADRRSVAQKEGEVTILSVLPSQNWGHPSVKQGHRS
jgi:hypothetical protein